MLSLVKRNAHIRYIEATINMRNLKLLTQYFSEHTCKSSRMHCLLSRSKVFKDTNVALVWYARAENKKKKEDRQVNHESARLATH